MILRQITLLRFKYHFLGFHLRIITIKTYNTNSITNRLRNVLRNNPILGLTGPIERTISSQTTLLFDINGRNIGKRTSLIRD